MPAEKAENGSVEVADNSLSSNDAKIINVILKHCIESARPTSVIWENVCKELNFKTAEVARERYRQLCKKHHWFEGSKDNMPTPTTSPKKRAPNQAATSQLPKENGATSATSGWEADVNSSTPVKKRKLNKMARATKQKTVKGNDAKKRCTQAKRVVSDSDEA
ncbi:uncharacterized protein GGS22DRAFT_166447 [Annulohypoxylon maeteangense]|uniref:uncharacterized protein n=1 Tax=Annulohypoxylon maeteangense TaxID=1927788 RepID=UPI002008B199|nr:uncharacterized protein GGS22DRAFT_166447 [Annulohypoxylon maeteangense]KAI0883927.1 hypothetical protein GGS22DRAFT_166447 [Annulohypoxylon maeteangense]